MENDNYQKPPELKEVVWRFVVKYLGTKASLIIFIAIGLVIAAIQVIPTSLKSLSEFNDTFKSTFPKKPKFDPLNFTIGIYIASDDKIDKELIKSLKQVFYRYPHIRFHEITSVDKKINEKVRNEKKSAEDDFLNWISETGANGVIWGEKININGNLSYLLNWSHPDVYDFAVSRIYNFIHPPTTQFPSADFSQSSSLLSVYIKQIVRQLNIERNTPEDLTPQINDKDKESVKAVFDSICNGITHQEDDCFLFAQVRLEFYMMDSYSQSLFPKRLYDGEEFNIATKTFLNIPDAPQTEAEFQTYLLTLDYIFLMLERSFGSKEWIDNAKNWCDLSRYKFGLPVQRKYPFFKTYAELFGGQISYVNSYDDNSWNSDSSNLNKSQITEIEKALLSVEESTKKMIAYKEVGDFQKGIFLNRLGMMFLKAGLKKQSHKLEKGKDFIEAIKYIGLADEKLDWFKYRTPLYYATTKLNLAIAINSNPFYNENLHELLTAKNELEEVIKISINRQFYNIEQEARLVNSNILSKIAAMTKNSSFHCSAVTEWSNSQSLNPNMSISLIDDTSIDSIFVRFYNDAPKEVFEKCLKENDFDPNKVYKDLGGLLKKK